MIVTHGGIREATDLQEKSLDCYRELVFRMTEHVSWQKTLQLWLRQGQCLVVGGLVGPPEITGCSH